jgi:hypothetical protein
LRETCCPSRMTAPRTGRMKTASVAVIAEDATILLAAQNEAAEVLAMIADTHPETAKGYPRPIRETDEWLSESATEFCAALDRYAGRARGG